MPIVVPAREIQLRHKNILRAAAKLFLEKGYSQVSMIEIAKEAGIGETAMYKDFKTKENILCELVRYVLEGQFETTAKFLSGITDDKILFYAAETTLQLYMTESGEYIRDLYSTAYSLPNTTKIIQDTITVKLEAIFKDHLPDLDTKDFYLLEIASGGIMRGFMTTPCSERFTMEEKVRTFLETTFRVYRVPQDKIEEAVRFVSRFDYETIARQTIDSMLAYLEEKIS